MTHFKSQTTLLRKGFTSIEVFAVLALVGIFAAVGVPKYVDMSAVAELQNGVDVPAFAKERAINAAVAELNGRESLAWGKQALATGGWNGDAMIFTAVNKDLGDDYVMTAALVNGAKLSFLSGTAVFLSRTASTADSPGVWSQ